VEAISHAAFRRGSRSSLACNQTEERHQSVIIARQSPHNWVFVLLRRSVPDVIAQQAVALRQEFGATHIDQPSLFPVLRSPLDGVHVRPVLLVLGPKIFWCVLDGPNFVREGNVHYADEAAWLDELGDVAQIAIISAIIEEGIDSDYRVEEVFCERQTMRVLNGKTFASHPSATARLRLSLGDVALSTAQASIPNSRARKIELVALPHPRSRIRIPARRGSRRAKLSAWHSAFCPSALSRIHCGSYFAVRGNAIARPLPRRRGDQRTTAPQEQGRPDPGHRRGQRRRSGRERNSHRRQVEGLTGLQSELYSLPTSRLILIAAAEARRIHYFYSASRRQLARRR